LNPHYSFDDFVVGQPNEFAYACARRVAEHPACSGFNPLFLYGEVGSGKTHLLQAIAGHLTHKTGKTAGIIYMSAGEWASDFAAASQSQMTIAFEERLRTTNVLIIDGLQDLAGKANADGLLLTVNALLEAGKQIVVSADKSPSELNALSHRLRSRLGCGMVADLRPTTPELRSSILGVKAGHARIDLPENARRFLAGRISSLDALEAGLSRLAAHATLSGRPITLETVQMVLHDVLKAHKRRVTIEEIQNKVAQHYDIHLTDLSSARRARAVVRPRQVAMFLARQLTRRSLPEIGRKFGDRDHTTVMYAVSRVGELMAQDGAFAEDVTALHRLLEA
jgi:chromosomal replication initiator protein